MDKSPGFFDIVESNWLVRAVISFCLYMAISFIHGILRESLYAKYSKKVLGTSYYDAAGNALFDVDLNENADSIS